MAAQPQVLMNAAKGGTFAGAPAGALTSAVGASVFAAKIECALLSTVNWQATLFPVS